jgi:non-ribosomal peptide synthetase component F
MLGAAWAGATYVPLNPKHPADRLSSIIRRAGIDAVVIDEKGAAHLKSLSDVLPPAVLMPEATLNDTLASPVAVPPDHLVYIIFTSGTTGVPKGVMVNVSSLAYFRAATQALYHITPNDRFGQFCETSFDLSIFELYGAWDGGASLHVVPEDVLIAPGGFIRQHELTVWTSVPSLIVNMRKANQLQPGALPTLRWAFMCGEPLAVGSVKTLAAAAPNCVIDNEYGPTEATCTCMMLRIAGEPVETPGRGIVSIGTTYPGTHAAIVAPEGRFLAPGETGELALAGPQLAVGYLDDPEQTARRYPTLNHPTLGACRWYLTGDLA